jgi:hypothetical protein
MRDLFALLFVKGAQVDLEKKAPLLPIISFCYCVHSRELLNTTLCIPLH